MRRIRLVIEYQGARYVGWQRQPNGISVQACIEKAIFEITGETVSLQGSGRTDSGVHALAQVAHFDTQARMPGDKFAIALNMHLPQDIRILFSQDVSPDFHARFSAKEKSYRYTLQTGPHARVLHRERALHVHVPLDLPAMEAAAAMVVGTHDFRAFKSAGIEMENTTRQVLSSGWSREGILLHYDVTGTGFLYNMVRILVGTMLDIGRGYLPLSTMEEALLTGDRNRAGATAPAHGLTMMRVRYPDFDTDEVLRSL